MKKFIYCVSMLFLSIEVAHCSEVPEGNTNSKHLSVFQAHAEAFKNSFKDKQSQKKYYLSCFSPTSNGLPIDSPKARNKIAMCLAYGIWCDVSYNLAIKYFKDAVAGGNRSAMFNLGSLYEFGIGCDKDEKQAFELYRQAALKGQRESMYRLAICYLQGKGCKGNLKLAAKFFIDSVNAGNNSAISRLYDLGERLYFGRDAEVDVDSARRCLEVASEKKHPKAKYLLALSYMKDSNYERAKELLKESGELGCFEAYSELGDIYLNSTINEEENARIAFQYYEKAAELGQSNNLLLLACSFSIGKIVPRDPVKALKYFESAYQKNISTSLSLLSLGDLYKTGEGGIKDDELAFKYYLEAASRDPNENGTAESMMRVGGCYLKGIGVAFNNHKGIEWLLLAKKHGASVITRIN